MKENTVWFIALSLLLISIIIGYILKSSKQKFFTTHKKKLEITFIYVPIALSFLLLIYISSGALPDFIYVNFIFSILVCFAFVVDKRINKNYKLKLVSHFLMYIVIFFIVKEANKHLILPLAHNWIIVVLILNLRQVFKKNVNFKMSIFLANALGIISLFILFNYFSEPFNGISKQEYIVKNYLLEEKGYNESEIIELTRLTFPKEKEKRVFVSVKEQDRKAYIYHYKDGNIVKIEELKN